VAQLTFLRPAILLISAYAAGNRPACQAGISRRPEL